MTDQLLARCGVCTDEVSRDLEEALRAARSWGMREVELLEFFGKPVAEASAADLDRIGGLLRDNGLSVSAIGSLFLKLVELGQVRRGEVGRAPGLRRRPRAAAGRDPGRPGARRADRAHLRVPARRRWSASAIRRRGCRGAARCRTRCSRRSSRGCGSRPGWRPTPGSMLGLENVRSCWANSGYNTGRIVDATDHPALQVMLGPRQRLRLGRPAVPGGLRGGQGQICHVHVKDARVVDPSTGPDRVAGGRPGRGRLGRPVRGPAARRLRGRPLRSRPTGTRRGRAARPTGSRTRGSRSRASRRPWRRRSRRSSGRARDRPPLPHLPARVPAAGQDTRARGSGRGSTGATTGRSTCRRRVTSTIR